MQVLPLCAGSPLVLPMMSESEGAFLPMRPSTLPPRPSLLPPHAAPQTPPKEPLGEKILATRAKAKWSRTSCIGHRVLVPKPPTEAPPANLLDEVDRKFAAVRAKTKCRVLVPKPPAEAPPANLLDHVDRRFAAAPITIVRLQPKASVAPGKAACAEAAASATQGECGARPMPPPKAASCNPRRVWRPARPHVPKRRPVQLSDAATASVLAPPAPKRRPVPPSEPPPAASLLLAKRRPMPPKEPPPAARLQRPTSPKRPPPTKAEPTEPHPKVLRQAKRGQEMLALLALTVVPLETGVRC